MSGQRHEVCSANRNNSSTPGEIRVRPYFPILADKQNKRFNGKIGSDPDFPLGQECAWMNSTSRWKMRSLSLSRVATW